MSYRSFLFICVCALPLIACSGTKEKLGLTRRVPDEFAVVQRAPLEMPPDYYLRPPVPGTPRPQEQTPTNQAAQALLGQKPTNTPGAASQAESVLLQKANAGMADPLIRTEIDAETQALADKNKPTIKKILDLGGPGSPAPASVVDPVAEAARIKANKAAGQPVNTGTTTPIVQ